MSRHPRRPPQNILGGMPNKGGFSRRAQALGSRPQGSSSLVVGSTRCPGWGVRDPWPNSRKDLHQAVVRSSGGASPPAWHPMLNLLRSESFAYSDSLPSKVRPLLS